ncbi:MAG: 2-dehydro-3-deoxy-D-gluconate 5-dehydrogenase KduD [Desulfobacteraceae bacterium]|nr:2-dehydro-3-deoxy-D-gluconate 5-dehydrogenase KduD [Desulfobacteraceae bacterium]
MTIDQFNLKGKTAIVTGSSTGLGQAMALGLARAGADIVGVYNSTAPSNKELIEKMGVKFVGIQADLSNLSSVPLIIEKSIEAFGHIDILVNNAGIIRRNDALDFTESDWDDVMDVNIKSVFFLCQAAANQFIEQKTGGKIINIASMLSFQGGIKVSSYTASKSGVNGLTKLLACEWAQHQINVNAIAPGYMATANTEPIRQDPVRNRQILERIPAGDWGKPEDLQGAVVFLASEASNYVHGSTLTVDGGWLAR